MCEKWRCLRLLMLCEFQVNGYINILHTYLNLKKLRKLGAAIVNSWSKTRFYEVFQGDFAAVLSESTGLISLFRHVYVTKNNPKNGLPAESLLQKSQSLFLQPVKLWRLFLMIFNEQFSQLFGKACNCYRCTLFIFIESLVVAKFTESCSKSSYISDFVSLALSQ